MSNFTKLVNNYLMNIIISIFIIFMILNVDLSTLIKKKCDNFDMKFEKSDFRDFSTPVVSHFYLILLENLDKKKFLTSLDSSEILLNSETDIQRNISELATLTSILTGTIPEIHKVINKQKLNNIFSSSIVDLANLRGLVSLFIAPESIGTLPNSTFNYLISETKIYNFFKKMISKLIEIHRKSIVNLSILIIPVKNETHSSTKIYGSLIDNLKYLSKNEKSIILISSFKSNINNPLLILSFNDYIKKKIKFSKKENLKIYDILPFAGSILGVPPSRVTCGNIIKFKGINEKNLNNKLKKQRRYKKEFLNKLSLVTKKQKYSDKDSSLFALINHRKGKLKFSNKAIYISLFFLIFTIFIAYKFYSNRLFYTLCLIPPLLYSFLATQENYFNQKDLIQLIKNNSSSSISPVTINSILFSSLLIIILFFIYRSVKKPEFNKIINEISFAIFTLTFYTFLIYYFSFYKLTGDKFIPDFNILKFFLIFMHSLMGFFIVNIIISTILLVKTFQKK